LLSLSAHFEFIFILPFGMRVCIVLSIRGACFHCVFLHLLKIFFFN
jgi:hypothetical protein